MRYLGIARQEHGRILMPDAFAEGEQDATFEAIEIGGDILLIPNPLDRERLARLQRLANRSIEDHRKSLEGLAR